MISLSAAAGGSLAVIPAPSPAAVETRVEADAPDLAVRNSDDYGGAIVASFEAAAAGYRGAVTTGAALASRLYETGLASADVSGPGAALLPPHVLGYIGRAMATRGEAVLLAALEGDMPALWLSPCSDWDLSGGHRPRQWRYRLTMSGPSATESRNATADEVVHVRHHCDSRIPWRGRSPLSVAASTGALAGAWEQALREEGVNLREDGHAHAGVNRIADAGPLEHPTAVVRGSRYPQLVPAYRDAQGCRRSADRLESTALRPGI